MSSQDGLILAPRKMSRWFGSSVLWETLVCMSTHYRVETFIGVYSGDVKTQDGLVLVPREMSKWFGIGSSEDACLRVDALSGGDFYRCLLGRC